METTMDVFLGYASEDKEIAKRLAKDLEARGVQVWMDAARLTPGENWVEKLLRAVREAPNLVALVSKNTATSPHFSAELATALAAIEVTGSSRRIVPILIDKDASLPPLCLSSANDLRISTRQTVDNCRQ
jgi:hypothetical protein